jgi:two-component system, NtrC family, response regulator
MSETKPCLLVVEDDPGLQKQLRWSLDQYDVVLAESFDTAINQFRRHTPSIVTLDLGLPPHVNDATEGLRILVALLAIAPDTKVIVLTGQNDRGHALRAIGLGAYDFLAKPVDPDLLSLIVSRALTVANLQAENKRLLSVQQSPLLGLITRDLGMLNVCRMIEKVAPTSATVMINGESGTGKEVLARAVHHLSDRREGRFVAINCAAIPDNLLESELFGYERGAFTGAQKQTKGKVEYASGGTLFLDEIGDIPASLQAKLLRFLQERVIERLGGRDEISVDVRVVCATHQNLKNMIADGGFREDLYYRLSEIVVQIPPLRERPGDASLLAHAFAQSHAKALRKTISGVRQDACMVIENYPWPGNVRELDNVIKRAVIMADRPEITANDLGLNVDLEPIAPPTLRDHREDSERKLIQQTLGLTDGNIAKAAEMLGISRPTLYDMLKRFGLKE